MRILRVAQKVYPDVQGGGPYHVHALSRDQAAMGHDVTVLTVRADPSLPHVEERSEYTVVRFDPAVTLLGNAISPGLAQYLARAERFDVIHAHSHIYFATNLAAMARAIGDVPLAVTNHGLYSQTAPRLLFKPYLHTLGRWTFDQADVVFCYTETEKRRLRRLGVSSPVTVVPNGIDTEQFAPDGDRSDLIEKGSPVVLFVGRLVAGKRPTLAVDALARVRETSPDATLYFCGDGPLRTQVTERARELGIEDDVLVLGDVPYDEMPRIYRNADVLVLPSRSEGVPRTVLEAMATNLPVVVNELDQVTEIIGDGGRTVRIDDGSDLAAAVIETLSGENYSGRDRIVADHQWARTVSQTTANLQSLVDEDESHVSV